MKKVTLLTIAEQLNVSKALVSKALSHHPSVSPTTKDVIWKKAEELGYEIRAAKKSVSRANTGNVVMMVPRGYLADSQYWAKVIHGIEEEISKTNFSLIYAGVDMNLPVGEGMPSCIIDRKVDGVFVLGHIPEAYTNVLRQWEIPYVLVDSNQQDPEADHVSANNYLGAYSAVQSLLKREPQRIVFVGDSGSSMSFEERKRGFVQAINDFMLKGNQPIDVQYVSGMGVSGNGNYLSTEFEEQLEAVVKNNVNGISLFCANDMIALEVLSALNKWKIPCPGEASVIGFDNLPYCDLAQPKLSSVIVPIVDIGVRAAQLMIRRIEQPSVLPEHVMLVTKLIIRESSSYLTE